MAGKRTNIYNLTDVQDRPRVLRYFRHDIPPGGRLVLPASLIGGRVQTQRLAKGIAAKDIHVGPTPPSWYLKLKQERDAKTRARQAQKLPTRRIPEPVEAVRIVEPLFDIDDVMERLEKRTKEVIGKFATFVRPAPLLSDKMLKDDMLKAVRAALVNGGNIVPLKKAMELIED